MIRPTAVEASRPTEMKSKVRMEYQLPGTGAKQIGQWGRMGPSRQEVPGAVEPGGTARGLKNTHRVGVPGAGGWH